ncbi:MAG: ornithine carbamoyltransferase [bacterium]|nr:ornithine carbamoyltransferase [bacterium]
MTPALAIAPRGRQSDTVAKAPRHLLKVGDLDAAEITAVLDLAEQLKATRAVDQLQMLRGRTLAMLFEKPSLRTRVSFEAGMTQLGGHAIVASAADFMVGKRETPEDAARVLSRYVDAVMVRTHAHGPLERFAAAATVPVINGLSAEHHPCQALADILTIKEKLGHLSGIKVCYVGDARNNVAVSLLDACSLMGAQVTFACPPSLRPNLSGRHKRNARAFTSPVRAIADADVVYTDIWVSMGEEALTERRMAELLPYTVDEELMSHAAPRAIFMHCLPAHRGEEMTEGVLEGEQSVVFDQAENRLHVQKALLLYLLTDTTRIPLA